MREGGRGARARQLAAERGRARHRARRRRAGGGDLAVRGDRPDGAGGPRSLAAARPDGSATMPTPARAARRPTRRFSPRAAREDPGRAVDPGAAVIALYTAAFGGRPNGALLSHDAVLSQALMVALVQRITEDTVYLNSGPMFHMATLMTTFATLAMGGTNVMTRRVDAEELCRLIEAERCNYGFFMGPTSAQILELNQDGRYDLSSLRTFGGNAAWNAMVQVDDSPWGAHPAGYGQTEATGMLTFNALGIGRDGHERPSVALGPGAHRRPRGQRCARRRDRRDRGPRPGAHQRLPRPARAERRAHPRGLVAHQRPRPARGRRVHHLRGAPDPDRQVRRREHLPGRGRGLPHPAPRRSRRRPSSACPTPSGPSAWWRSWCAPRAPTGRR